MTQRTPEQDAIISAVAAQPESLMIEAGAGCGKSSTLEMAAPGIRVPTLALAFNKSTAVELGKKLPPNFQVKTLNGLGHGAWTRANPNVTRWTLDEKKLGKLVTQVAKDRRVDLTRDQWDELRNLVVRAMQRGLVPAQDPYAPGLVPDTQEGWRDCANGMGSDDLELLWELGREVLKASIGLARSGTISFDDQVYCSTMLGGRFPRFPVGFVDESQDLSPLNHLMLERSVGDRVVAVGDSRQAIYAFRGADSKSMRNMRRLRPSWVDLPLMTTFRCPKAIVARQIAHVPLFRAWDSNPDGRIMEWDREWTWPEVAQMAQRLGPPAVLCRNNAPLMSLAFKLIRGQVGVRMLGRDLGRGLVALIRKLCPEPGTTADTVRGKVSDWITKESSLAIANGHEERVDSIQDKGESILAVLESTECRTASELIVLLIQLFEREDGQVTLASGHKAKGLEWPLVVHLDPWRLPSKQARLAEARGDLSQMEQERNLLYVIETRTRHTLVLARLDQFGGG